MVAYYRIIWKAQVRRELDRLELLLEQIKAVEAERDVLLAVQQGAAPAPAAMLLNIKGIGPEFAAILWSDGLFRHFDNRRQVASYAGLAPTPWQSGSVDREQGVSKAGNPRLRTTLHPTRLAVAAQSAAIGAGSVVQGAGQPQWRPSQEDDHRGAGAQAAGGAMEICDRRRCHGGCHCEEAPERRSEEIEVIYRDPISLGGSGWTNRTSPWPEKPLSRMVSSS